MFGYAAYGQASYAALGSSYFIATLSEDITVADVESVLRTQAASISEGILPAEVSSSLFAVVANIIEALQTTDASTAVATFNSSNVIETLSIDDTGGVVRTQYAISTEPISLTDAPIGFAWVKIDNTESTQWVLVDNRQ